MFSTGTFLRYMFEIDSTHKKMQALYQQIAEQASDETIRKEAEDFASQVQADQQTVQQIRDLMGM